MDTIISMLLLVPLLGCLLIGLLPKEGAGHARVAAIVCSGILCFISLVMACSFNYGPESLGLQFEQRAVWFSLPVPVEYHVGVDGMSLCLVGLTSFITLMAVLASKNVGQHRPKLYYSMVMLLTLSILGVFVSMDLLQFFVMYELELVPMYFLIAIWGGPNRNYAAMKFLIYTFFGGALMLAAILLTYLQLWQSDFSAITFNMVELQRQTPMIMPFWQCLAFLGFFLAFIIKLPSFPFHTWLPDAHVEAPTPISMILAGLLLKMGSYGLVRICLGLFPDVVTHYGHLIILLGAFNVVWAAIACLVQDDMKRIIAFSSVSHMGFVLMGVGALSSAALNGAVFQMISHGVISAALFFLVGVVYDRCHTRRLSEIGGGLAKFMPFAFYFWMLAAMANLGLPGLAGFVAEAAVFYGTMTSPLSVGGPDPFMVRFALVFAATGVILTAGYMLWLLKRLFYGPEPSFIPASWHLSDMTRLEKVVACGLSVFIIALGVYPLMLTNSYRHYTDNMCQNIQARMTTLSIQ